MQTNCTLNVILSPVVTSVSKILEEEKDSGCVKNSALKFKLICLGSVSKSLEEEDVLVSVKTIIKTVPSKQGMFICSLQTKISCCL